MLSTTLSAQGQVAIPQELCEQRQWHAGMRLLLEDLPQGVLLRPAPEASLFAPSTIDELMGCVGYHGKALSDADIAHALEAEGRKQR